MGGHFDPPANSETKEATTMKLFTVVAYYNTSITQTIEISKLPLFYCLWLLFCFLLDGEKYSKK